MLALLVFLIVLILISVISFLTSVYSTSTATTTIFIAPTHQIFVTNLASDSVSVINASNDVVVKTIEGLSRPEGIAVSPNGAQVVITNSGNDTVSVVNTLTDSIIKNITVGHYPDSVAFSPEGNSVYVLNKENGTISVINTTTYTVTNTTHGVGDAPTGIAVSPDGKQIFIAAEGYVAVINTTNYNIVNYTDTYIYNLSLGSYTGIMPYDIVISPNGEEAFVSSISGSQVYVINTKTYNVIKTILIGFTSDPDGSEIAISPYGTQVIVAGTNTVMNAPNLDGTVFMINTTTYNITKTLSRIETPYAIAFSPNGSNIYVSDYGTKYIYVLNSTTLSITNTINVGELPSGIVVT